MGHFTIDLPENLKGDVRWGMVFKKNPKMVNGQETLKDFLNQMIIC